MTAHILHVALGPVQDFIAQARRTRDLWYGSYLISELSRTAARVLHEQGAELLIPALAERELDPNSPTAVPNKLYALLKPTLSPEAVARQVRAVVKADLHAWADAARQKVADCLATGVDEAWNEQIDTLLEFSAAWTEYNDDLAAARLRVDAAAGARKQLRDFGRWTHQRGNVPKSSLDGIRDTVLPPGRGECKRKRERFAAKHGLASGEELDAIGVVKRVGAEPERFAPIINIALAPWIAQIEEHEPQLLELCRVACEAADVSRVREPAWAEVFAYEASILLPIRWESILEEKGGDPKSKEWKRLAESVYALHRAISPFDPYVACLVADGDKMGDAIEQIRTPQALQDFSKQLSKFAHEARTIIEGHQGSLVYAGGDDVLAFVPVARALVCANALRGCFNETLRIACEDAGVAKRPTLSVGLGIGHYMESMGELLELGRRAEALAKGGALPELERRNAVAVLVRKRSGSERSWRMSWDGGPVEQIARDQELFRAGLPTRKVYEIESTLRRLPEPAQVPADQEHDFAELLTAEVRRSLARSNLGLADEGSIAVAGMPPDEGGYVERRKQVLEWTNRMLIARAFHEATPRPTEDKQ